MKVFRTLFENANTFKSALLTIITGFYLLLILFIAIIFAIGTFSNINVNAMAFMDLLKMAFPIVMALFATTFGLSLGGNILEKIGFSVGNTESKEEVKENGTSENNV